MNAIWRRPPVGLMIGWLTMFVIGTDLFVVSPLLPLIAADYDVSPATAGLAVTLFSLVYMASAPLFGDLADRVGRRPVLVLCLALFAVANLLTAAAASMAWLLASRVVAGIAAAGVSPSVYALVGGTAPTDRRASWMALVVSGLLVSLALGAPLGAWTGAIIGWQAVFAVLAGSSLCLVLPNLLIWPADTRRPQGAATADAPAPVLALRRLLPTVLWSTGLYGMYTYLGAGLAAAGFASEEVARAIFCYGLGAILGVLVGGRLADRLGTRVMIPASLFLLAACLILLRLAVHQDLLVAVALALTSAAAQLFFPAQQASLAGDFPTRRATMLAWNNSALFFGIGLGSLVGGQAVGLAGFDADLVLCAAIALFGGAVTTGLGRPIATRLGRAHSPV